MTKEKNKYIKYLTNLTLREKIIITISIVVFLVLVFYVLLIGPINKDIINGKEKINSLNVRKEMLINQNKSSNELSTKIYYADKKYNDLKEKFPKKQEQSKLLNSIINMESETNIEMKNITFQNEGKSKNNLLSAYGATIDVSGSYNNILKFIDKLENNKRELQVQSVTINKNKNNEYDGNISLNYFYLSNGEAKNE